MNKVILKQLYKPVCIHDYSDTYFDALIEVIVSVCDENTFEWFIKCIKGFTLGELDEEFRLSLSGYLSPLEEDSSPKIIAKNKAELSVFAQAIIYECIFYNEDKVRASILSLALNTIMFGIDNSLNQFYILKMKDFYREECKKSIDEFRESENSIHNEILYDFIKTENKVIKWMLNIDQRRNPELSDEQSAFNLGMELANKSNVKTIFNYTEAYITKLLLNPSISKNKYSKKIDIQKIFEKLNYSVPTINCDNAIIPILSKTIRKNLNISLIDLAIEVYYEQMLVNNIKLNYYA